MVVYQSVETGEVWVRPKAMWNDVIPQSLSHKGLRENSAEADQESQDNTGGLQLSADNRSTCVAQRKAGYFYPVVSLYYLIVVYLIVNYTPGVNIILV